ncbi:MAG: hypothetical protein ACOCQD_04320 [archaeon]
MVPAGFSYDPISGSSVPDVSVLLESSLRVVDLSPFELGSTPSTPSSLVHPTDKNSNRMTKKPIPYFTLLFIIILH